MQNVAVLGSGTVGETLANGFLKHGYAVMRASRDPGKLAAWKAGAGANASTGTFAEAAKWGDIAVLAVKGGAAEEAVALAGPDHLAGKLVLDATNPIADKAPVNGVLQFFTGPNESLIEKLQAKAPKAHFVKCWSSVGAAFMVNPPFKDKPTMFICGSDEGAKKKTGEILGQFGWEAYDMGAIEAGRAIEPLCMLYCIPGIAKHQWTHAFKLLQL